MGKKSIKFPDFSFSLAIDERILPLRTDNYKDEDFYSNYEARLLFYPEDESKPPVEAGKVSYKILNLAEAAENGESFYWLFDSISGNLLNCWENLYQPEGCELKQSVEDLLDTPMSSNLLYVESLEVNPEYRGHRLGLAILRTLMQEYASACGLIVLIAQPYNTSDGKQEDSCDCQNQVSNRILQEKAASRRLGKYYSKLGFKRIGRSNIYAFNLDYKIP